MKTVQILAAVLCASPAWAEGFSSGTSFDGSPGVNFARCSTLPKLSAAGRSSLTLVVRAEGKTKRVVLIPEVDGVPQKAIPVGVTRSAMKSAGGKALSFAATASVPLPAGAKSVAFRCLGSDDAFLGVVESSAAPPELSAGSSALLELPPPPLPEASAALPELPAGPPAEAGPALPSLPVESAQGAQVAVVKEPVKPVAQQPSGAGLASSRTILATRVADHPSEVAPAVGLLPAQRPAPTTSDEGSRLVLGLRAGAQRSSETFTEPISLGLASGDLTYAALPRVPIRLGVDWRASRQGYTVGGLKANGQAAFNPQVDEQRTDLSLSAGYDLGPLLLKSGRLSALPTVGARYLAVRNGSFPVDLFGPELGARLRFAVSDGLYLLGGTQATFNALKKHGTLSAVGRPFADVAIQAGLGLPLAGGHALELQYVGDVLPMTYDTRVAHGACVGVRSGF